MFTFQQSSAYTQVAESELDMTSIKIDFDWKNISIAWRFSVKRQIHSCG